MWIESKAQEIALGESEEKHRVCALFPPEKHSREVTAKGFCCLITGLLVVF